MQLLDLASSAVLDQSVNQVAEVDLLHLVCCGVAFGSRELQQLINEDRKPADVALDAA